MDQVFEGSVEKVLVLRTCSADLKSHGGFTWPEAGPVEAPDWDPRPECGRGLHGWLWGEGDGSLGNMDADAKWLVVEVAADTTVQLDGKVKYPRGVVVHCGDRYSASAYLVEHGASGRAIIGATVTGGYAATVTGGYAATVTGGYAATVTGGARSTVTGGYAATVTGGDAATVTGGDAATVTGGARSTVTGGARSTVTGGDAATLQIRWWDGAKNRYRIATAYVGEDGILPGRKYRLNDQHAFEEISPEPEVTAEEARGE